MMPAFRISARPFKWAFYSLILMFIATILAFVEQLYLNPATQLSCSESTFCTIAAVSGLTGVLLVLPTLVMMYVASKGVGSK